ncbi:MAG: aminotransferase class I/II-fold pyridoxal phosphate-dependent enzyme [Lachnospiraceae bacterium]|nr:aminotransferase class I/II-fold pyridoxal phosphate-dependent enzyme [Lachnospiraceae bacterium]
MNVQNHAFHGSDLEKIEAEYGIDAKKIISFSANVNPLGCPKSAEDALKNNLDAISRYPDRDYRRLKEAIASYTGADPTRIVLGSGVTELLSLFLGLILPKSALIAGPAYSEYEKDLKRLGCKVRYCMAEEEKDFIITKEDMLKETSEGTDLVILCNPNNPTSGAFTRSDISFLAGEYEKKGILLLIDETYVEFSEKDLSAASLISQFSNLIVLRGTSKFFATPGLRLGYALTGSKELLAMAEKKQDPWNINAAAEICGSVMFQDKDYIRQVRRTVEAEKQYVCESLLQIPGIHIFPVFANFVLVKLPEGSMTSGMLFEELLKKGMMIRDCSTFPTLGSRFIRICFMSHEDNVRLVTAIKEALTEKTE